MVSRFVLRSRRGTVGVPKNEVVWLTEDRTYAILIRELAYVSLVRYTRGGIDYEVWIENNEIERWKDHAIEYESE